MQVLAKKFNLSPFIFLNIYFKIENVIQNNLYINNVFNLTYYFLRIRIAYDFYETKLQQ